MTGSIAAIMSITMVGGVVNPLMQDTLFQNQTLLAQNQNPTPYCKTVEENKMTGCNTSRLIDPNWSNHQYGYGIKVDPSTGKPIPSTPSKPIPGRTSTGAVSGGTSTQKADKLYHFTIYPKPYSIDNKYTVYPNEVTFKVDRFDAFTPRRSSTNETYVSAIVRMSSYENKMRLMVTNLKIESYYNGYMNVRKKDTHTYSDTFFAVSDEKR